MKRILFFMSFMIFGVVYGLWTSWFLTTKNIVVSGFYFVFFGQVFQKHTIGHLDLNGIESLNKPRRLCKKGHIIYKMAQHHFKASIHEESRQKETSVKTVRIHKSCLSRQPWWTGQFWPHWHASMCAHALERARAILAVGVKKLISTSDPPVFRMGKEHMLCLSHHYYGWLSPHPGGGTIIKKSRSWIFPPTGGAVQRNSWSFLR